MKTNCNRTLGMAACVMALIFLVPVMAWGDSPAKSDMQTIREFLNLFGVVLSPGSEITARTVAPGSASYLRSFEVGKLCTVGLDPVSGTLRSFAIRNLPEIKGGTTSVDIVTENLAFDRCVPILAQLGLPTDREEYKIVRMGSGILPDGKNERFTYVVKKPFLLKGIPEVGRGVYITLAEHTGEIWALRYNPVVEPETWEEPKINFVAAVEKAKADLPGSKATAGGEVIVNADGTPLRAIVVKVEHDPSGTSVERAYLCWEVPFVLLQRGNKFQGKAWVRCDDGATIDIYIGPGDR